MKISKLLFVLILVFIASFAFAKNYQYSIIVFPATCDESISDIESAPIMVSEAMSKNINYFNNSCSLAYHPQNPLLKYMVSEQQLEESDLELPLDPSNYDRIAQALEADAYCVINVSNFKNDIKKFKTSCVFEVKVIPVGSEEPIFSCVKEVSYGAVNGYWKKISNESAFKKNLNSFKGKFEGAFRKFNARKAKPVKEVEKIDLTQDLSEE